MQTWMLTGPRTIHKREIEQLFEQCDVKEYIIAKETGKGGYEHWQIRCKASRPDFFEYVSDREPKFHIEKAESDHFEYERKEGRYWTSMDTTEIRKQRFGKPNKTQQAVLNALYRTNDREIVLWYSDKGNIGKSWLVGHLWEIGKAYYCQPQDTVKGMKQDIASDYMKHGWRDCIVVDLPRTWKWTKDLYCALESIKDGLIKDTRYNSDTINIKGVKILVCSNSLPKFDNLSYDRWVVIENTVNRRSFS